MNADGNKKIMANNIKKHMNRLGITNQQLCDALNFKYTTFMDWIKAATYPRIDKIEAMARYFKCEKSDLIEEKIGIGKKIRAWRSEKAISEQMLAENAGITIEKLAQIENAECYPSEEELEYIASALGLSVAFLLDDLNLKGLTVSIYNDYFAESENPTTQEGSEVDPVTMELLSMVNNATDDERQVMLEMLRLLKAQRGKG